MFQYGHKYKNNKDTSKYATPAILNYCIVVSIDADTEGWSTAFVKNWLQTDFSPTSIAKILFPPELPEKYVCTFRN